MKTNKALFLIIMTLICRNALVFGYDINDLKKAEQKDRKLSGANLKGADLIRADMFFADLSNADLSDAIMNNANLRGANLRGANMTGAIMYEADLYQANLTAPGCRRSIWPAPSCTTSFSTM